MEYRLERLSRILQECEQHAYRIQLASKAIHKDIAEELKVIG
jgi:hypothetical protein